MCILRRCLQGWEHSTRVCSHLHPDLLSRDSNVVTAALCWEVQLDLQVTGKGLVSRKPYHHVKIETLLQHTPLRRLSSNDVCRGWTGLGYGPGVSVSTSVQVIEVSAWNRNTGSIDPHALGPVVGSQWLSSMSCSATHSLAAASRCRSVLSQDHGHCINSQPATLTAMAA